MAEPVRTFDFDIQPSITRISRNILPDGEAEITFQVRNSGDCSKRAEAVLEPRSWPMGPGAQEDLADWLQLVEPPQYDYQPQSHRNYTVKIKATAPVVPGRYSFRLLLVGHEDPDRECMASDEVSFNVVARRVQPLPFVIGGIVLLLLLAIGIIYTLNTSKPSPALGSTLSLITPVNEVTVGQPVVYQLQLQNLFAETVTEDVVMEYTYPAGIVGAWATVEPATNLPAARCGSTGELLRCVFGKIEPQQNVDLRIFVLPGRPDSAQDISTQTSPAKANSPTGTATSQVGQIDNSGRFTLHWQEKGTYHEDLNLAVDHAVLPLNSAKGSISGAAIPAVNVASVGLPVRISLVGWNNAAGGGPVSLEYQLPRRGMRFASYPEECEQKKIGNDFVLRCTSKSDAPAGIQIFPIQVIALQPSTGYPQILRGLVTEAEPPLLAAATSALAFNGIDEWAQLGYSGLPDTKDFTVEMWVNPYSLEDGQALIGAHRQTSKTVLNRFLVGYYNGSINVNVLGECQNLKLPKTTDPFHLTVVVKGNPAIDQRDVTVYKDGRRVEMQAKACCDAACPGSGSPPADDGVDLNWVIGQDWDPNGSGIIASDFFHGALSDVRIYAGALTESNVQEDMSLPPSLCKPGLGCDRPDLIGWWPLASSDQAAAGQPAECILSRTGAVKATTATDASCSLIDLSPNHRNGARSGGTWENKTASFGDALAFNGSSAVYLSNLLLSEFREGADTTVASIGTAGACATTPAQAAATTTTPPASNAPTPPPVMISPLVVPSGISNELRAALKAIEATLNARAATLDAREAAAKATETSLQAAETALAAAPTPVGTPRPAAKTIVPVTISAWVYVDTVPSQQQTILAASFASGRQTETARVRVIIASDGHVQAIYETTAHGSLSSTRVRDDKTVPAGRWIHYAVAFWFDKSEGTLIQKKLLLFRNGELVKPAPSQDDGGPNLEMPSRLGLYLGGLETSGQDSNQCVAECFTGRIDEVRIWNRALYNPQDTGHISPEIDLWRRLPGVAFDEYAYWSFDNHVGANAQGLCPSAACGCTLFVDGPAWIPNDLSIDYTE